VNTRDRGGSIRKEWVKETYEGVQGCVSNRSKSTTLNRVEKKKPKVAGRLLRVKIVAVVPMPGILGKVRL